MTAADVADLLATRNPQFRRPSTAAVAAMQCSVDAAAQRLSPTRARELARIWLGR